MRRCGALCGLFFFSARQHACTHSAIAQTHTAATNGQNTDHRHHHNRNHNHCQKVYRAKLRTADGVKDVALKVQRPGVAEAIALDTYILRYAAGERGFRILKGRPFQFLNWVSNREGVHRRKLRPLPKPCCANTTGKKTATKKDEQTQTEQRKQRKPPMWPQKTPNKHYKTTQHNATGALRAARRLNTDLPALVDEWASSLFRELDYRR